MRLTYRQVEYLCEVADQKSITLACRELNISQSSVLAAIAAAEDATGSRLFSRRKGHGVDLTPAGHKFVVSARRFLAAGDEFGRSLSAHFGNEQPSLRLACFSPLGSLLVPPVLKRYVQANGDFNITLLEGDQTELRSWLASGVVDLVITYDLGEEFGHEVTPICRVPAHALLHRNDPDSCNTTISMNQLCQKPHILLDLPETRSYLLALFDFAGQRPSIGLRTRSYETIRSAVANGLGASMLNMRPPESSPDTKDLVRIPISDDLRQPTLIVVDPYGRQKPEYVRCFIQTLYRYFLEIGPKSFAVTTPERMDGLLHPDPDLSRKR